VPFRTDPGNVAGSFDSCRRCPAWSLDDAREGARFDAALAAVRAGDRRGLRTYLLLLKARDPIVRNAVADTLAGLTDSEQDAVFRAAGF
jgi:hypothetical protein